MNPRPLLLALALAMPAAHADESANASAAARASAATAAKPAANAVEARKELVELRSQIGVLSRRMAELSMQLGDAGPQAYAFRYLGDADRGMIGVVLSSDDAGARIDALTPAGPASRAGLQSGDVLVSINGKELPRTDSRAAHAEARRLLADLDVGENVRLGYRRNGGDVREVTLAAERRAALNWQHLFVDSQEADARIERNVHVIERDVARADREVRYEHAREAMNEAREAMREMRHQLGDSQHGKALAGMRMGMPWWGINLVPLNPGLGRYFGTDQGVLVLSAQPDLLKELEAGDVITRVGSQDVERPEQALRALRDHDAGDTVPVAILRDRKARTLNVVVPEYKAIFDIRPLPVPPAPPVPPAAPAAPPAPPAPPPPPDAGSMDDIY